MNEPGQESAGPFLEPGDVILVGRILGLRAWVRSPLSCAVSYGIQRSTGSPWNHVACYVGDEEIVEAEWNLGLSRSSLDEYRSGKYRLAIVRPPRVVDRERVVAAWLSMAERYGSPSTYSFRTLLLMKVAGILFGHDGISRVVRNDPNDEAWICSEVGAEGWFLGGFPGAREVFVTPKDFAMNWERVGADFRVIEDPRRLAAVS